MSKPEKFWVSRDWWAGSCCDIWLSKPSPRNEYEWEEAVDRSWHAELSAELMGKLGIPEPNYCELLEVSVESLVCPDDKHRVVVGYVGKRVGMLGETDEPTVST